MMQLKDLDYLKSLLADLPQRARLHPDALFTQLCSLSVGPIETYQSGQGLAKCPELSQMCAAFEPLQD
jgi:predicted component of type VI protein secretion system